MDNTTESRRKDREDEEKLIPAWSLAADSQIIVLGLVVLGVILGSFLILPRLFGDGDTPLADVSPTISGQVQDAVPAVVDDTSEDDPEPVATTTTIVTLENNDSVDLSPDVAASISGFGGITGSANGSIAILEGFVGTSAESDQAEAEALGVAGITEVDNRLVVLEQQVLDAANGSGVGLEGAGIQMDGTTATVTGLVSNELDAASVMAAAEAVSGVTPPAINELRVLQPEVDAVVAELGIEQPSSPVETDDSTSPISRVVTLTGSVASDEAKAAAEAKVQGVDGVTDVNNQLEVTGPTDEDVTTDLNALFELSPIEFRSGSDVILDESLPTLQSAIEILQGAAADIKLEVQGYTDTSGGNEANQRLSERRAAAVRQFLVDGGVGADVLTSAGFGETTQFGPELADNRRVRFQLL